MCVIIIIVSVCPYVVSGGGGGDFPGICPRKQKGKENSNQIGEIIRKIKFETDVFCTILAFPAMDKIIDICSYDHGRFVVIKSL